MGTRKKKGLFKLVFGKREGGSPFRKFAANIIGNVAPGIGASIRQNVQLDQKTVAAEASSAIAKAAEKNPDVKRNVFKNLLFSIMTFYKANKKAVHIVASVLTLGIGLLVWKPWKKKSKYGGRKKRR